MSFLKQYNNGKVVQNRYSSIGRNFDKLGDIVSRWSDMDSIVMTTKVIALHLII